MVLFSILKQTLGYRLKSGLGSFLQHCRIRGFYTGGYKEYHLLGFCVPPAYLLALSEIISSTLKMEAIRSSETAITTQQTTWRHIPEDDTLLQHHIQITSH
jgi:hypothetical protein